MIDLLIEDAKIVDGTGNPAFCGSIAVQGDRIAAVTRGRVECAARRRIDARGLVVSPGFIDTHTHSDYSIFIHNEGRSTLKAGVTTELAGMCGYGVFPRTNEERRSEVKARMAAFSQVEADRVPDGWQGLNGWLQVLRERGIGCNTAHLCGHGAIRAAVMGPEGQGGERVHPSTDELQRMKEMVREAMRDGAFGMSSGLMYPPARNAATAEVRELVSAAAETGGVHASHIRGEAELLIPAVQEFIGITEWAGGTATISHHKAFGRKNWGKTSYTLQILSEARARGIDVLCDVYPWEYAAQANLGAAFYTDFELSPRDSDELLRVLGDDEKWGEMKDSILRDLSAEEQARWRRSAALQAEGVPAGDTYDRVHGQYVVHSPAHPDLQGRPVGEVHERLGGDHWLDALRRLYLEDEGLTQIASGRMWEDEIASIVRYPHSCISTDSFTFGGEYNRRRPSSVGLHPRNYGSFAKVLGHYVREEGVLTLEDAVRKMTSLPARVINLPRRGIIAPGMYADMTIFDEHCIGNRADYCRPDVHPAGIEHVMVNGVIAVKDGELTGELAGHVLASR